MDIVSLLKNFVFFVGGGDKREFNNLLVAIDDKETDVNELFICLYKMIKACSVSKMYLYPNFRFNWLYGPSGYVTTISKSKMVNFDLFTNNLFRVISIVEINIPNNSFSDIDSLEKQKQLRNAIRLNLPLETDNYPTLESNFFDSWSPALGGAGSKIGFYSFSSQNGVDILKRRFIVIDSGLHHQTVQMYIDYLTKLTIDNDRCSKTFNAVEELNEQKYLTSNIQSSWNNDIDEIKYFRDEFSDGSIAKNLLQISIENNKRLAYLFCRITDQSFIDQDHYVTSHDSKFKVPNDAPVDMHNSEVVSYVIKILNAFPNGAVIDPSTVLDFNVRTNFNCGEYNELLANFQKSNNNGFKLGLYLFKYRDENKKTGKYDNIMSIIQNKSIELQEYPKTVSSVYSCDYNSFRDDYNNIYLYSDTTCVDSSLNYHNFTDVFGSDKHAVIRQLLPLQGYEVYNCDLFNNVVISSGKIEMNYNWKNSFGNGFPITIPKSYCEHNPSSLSQSGKFFSLSHNGQREEKVLPLQLCVKYRDGDDYLMDKNLKNDIFNSVSDLMPVRLLPEFVYLSPYLERSIFKE